jgi:hypothetical protein
MKRLAFFLVMLLLCSAATAQKLKVVVAAVGAEPPQKTNALAALETELKKAFVKDGRFTAITRDEAARKSGWAKARTGALKCCAGFGWLTCMKRNCGKRNPITIVA